MKLINRVIKYAIIIPLFVLVGGGGEGRGRTARKNLKSLKIN